MAEEINSTVFFAQVAKQFAQYDYAVTKFGVELTEVGGTSGYCLYLEFTQLDSEKIEHVKGFISISALSVTADAGIDSMQQMYTTLANRALVEIQQRHEVEDLIAGRIKNVGELR